MRSLLPFVCAVAAVTQTSPITSFSGIFDANAPTIAAVAIDASTGSCQTTGYTYSVAMVNYTFATAGVRVLNAFNVDFVGVVKVGDWYDMTNLCNGSAVFPLVEGQAAISSLYPYGAWFEAATYTFIIGGSSGSSFGGEVWDGIQGQTWVNSTMNRTWTPMTDDGSGQCTQSGSASYPSLYDTKVVSVNTSGYYNVFLTFAQNLNLTDFSLPYGYPSYAVVAGDVSGWDLGTVMCQNVTFVAGAAGYRLNVQSFNLWLVANQTYTFVVSGGYFDSNGNTYYGHYSLTLSPGQRYTFRAPLAPTFTPPQKSSCPSGCTADTTSLPYAYASFNVPAYSQFWIWATQNDGVNGTRDLEFYLYNAANALLFTCGPLGTTTCFDTRDSLDGVTYSAGASTTWSIVATSYYTSNNYGTDASFDLYVVSGPSSYVPPPVSASPTMTPTKAPTMAPTNAMTPSMAPTAATNATTPTMAPTTSSSNTTSNTTRAPTTAKQGTVGSGVLFNPCLITVLSLIGVACL